MSFRSKSSPPPSKGLWERNCWCPVETNSSWGQQSSRQALHCLLTTYSPAHLVWKKKKRQEKCLPSLLCRLRQLVLLGGHFTFIFAIQSKDLKPLSFTIRMPLFCLDKFPLKPVCSGLMFSVIFAQQVKRKVESKPVNHKSKCFLLISLRMNLCSVLWLTTTLCGTGITCTPGYLCSISSTLFEGHKHHLQIVLGPWQAHCRDTQAPTGIQQPMVFNSLIAAGPCHPLVLHRCPGRVQFSPQVVEQK